MISRTDYQRGGTALLSDDERYRYQLTRVWTLGAPGATWIMLNPSTADERVSDATITRCIRFSREWGCMGLTVVNLYALRSADPRRLADADDPVGPGNDEVIARALGQAGAGPVIAAWGASPFAQEDRVKRVLSLAGGPVQCLGTTKAGHPRHPLYLPASTLLRPYAPCVDTQA